MTAKKKAPAKAKTPAKKAATKKVPAKKPTKTGREDRRLWLMYPAKLIKNPIVWELGRKFDVVTNIRQVSVTDEIGIVCLELNGERPVIKKAIQWLEKQGISVEPVEINVLES